MLALYGNNSPVGLHLQHTGWGVGVALAFVTLPFVVRAVQPVLLEIDRETEEAAASLGASNPTDLHLRHPAVADCRRCCPVRGWRSRGPSANSVRWC